MASVARILATKKSWSRMSLNDKDERIAEYLDALCNSTWEPDVRAYPSISEWQRLKKAPPDVNTTFLGLFLGYAGHMFSGSRPNTPRVRRYNTVNDNFMAALETKRIALQNFRAAFKNQIVSCTSVSFDELPTPRNAVVYCDPPYIGSQSARAMSLTQQRKLETFIKACLENNCDVYLSNDNVPKFDTLRVRVLKTWSNFRNKTDSIHKNPRGRTELLMKILL
jgi:hypothetical protein